MKGRNKQAIDSLTYKLDYIIGAVCGKFLEAFTSRSFLALNGDIGPYWILLVLDFNLNLNV